MGPGGLPGRPPAAPALPSAVCVSPRGPPPPPRSAVAVRGAAVPGPGRSRRHRPEGAQGGASRRSRRATPHPTPGRRRPPGRRRGRSRAAHPGAAHPRREQHATGRDARGGRDRRREGPGRLPGQLLGTGPGRPRPRARRPRDPSRPRPRRGAPGGLLLGAHGAVVPVRTRRGRQRLGPAPEPGRLDVPRPAGAGERGLLEPQALARPRPVQPRGGPDPSVRPRTHAARRHGRPGRGPRPRGHPVLRRRATVMPVPPRLPGVAADVLLDAAPGRAVARAGRRDAPAPVAVRGLPGPVRAADVGRRPLARARLGGPGPRARRRRRSSSLVARARGPVVPVGTDDLAGDPAPGRRSLARHAHARRGRRLVRDLDVPEPQRPRPAARLLPHDGRPGGPALGGPVPRRSRRPGHGRRPGVACAVPHHAERALGRLPRPDPRRARARARRVRR